MYNKSNGYAMELDIDSAKGQLSDIADGEYNDSDMLREHCAIILDYIRSLERADA